MSAPSLSGGDADHRQAPARRISRGRLQAARSDGASAPSTRNSSSGRSDLRPVPYEGPDGIRALLEGCTRFGWQPVLDGGNLIGAQRRQRRRSRSSRAASSSCRARRSKTCIRPAPRCTSICARCARSPSELGLGMLGLGFHAEMAARGRARGCPRAATRSCARYMPMKGKLGLDMMLRTCTVQVNLDFAVRSRHGAEIPRQPRAAADRHRAVRQLALHRGQAQRLSQLSQPCLDRCRSRSLRHAALRLRRRLRLRALCRLPARCADVFRLSRRQLHRCRRANPSATSSPASLPGLPGEIPTHERLGRPSDDRLSRSPPEALPRDARRRRRPVAAALRAAGAVDRAALRSAPRSTPPRTWSPIGRRRSASSCAARCRDTALKTPFRGGTLRDVAVAVVEIARDGLRRRARHDSAGQDESHFLETLFEIALSGRTPAEGCSSATQTRGSAASSRSSSEEAY